MRNGKGFTLVEMLIAIAILAIAVTGIITAFQTQVTSFSTQEAVTTAQTTGAVVLMKVAEDLRMAGYGIPKNVEDGTTTAIVSCVDNDNTSGSTDTVTLRYCLGPSGYYFGATPVNPNKTLNVPGAGFANGTVVKVLNLRREDLFPADNVTVTAVSGDNVTLSKGLYESSVPSDLGVFLGANTADIRYFIQGSGTENVRLMREATPTGGIAQPAEVVAFGVEDLQLAYGLDTDMNGEVDTYVDLPATAQLRQVLAVRLSVIMRSDKNEPATGAGTVQAENGPTRGGDGKRRRVFSTTVRLRNARVI